MFRRKIEKTLEKYYSDKDVKILIVEGAGYIDKTFIIRQTASKHFKKLRRN